MAAVVTEDWSDSPYARGQSGVRIFVVSDVANGADAIAATGIAVNDGYPIDARLRADVNPTVVLIGPAGPYKVTWSYIRPEGGEVTEDEPNPLDQPVVWTIDDGTLTEPSDVDARGNAIANTGGFFLDNVSMDDDFVILTAVKNQSSYDLAYALAHRNRVNSDTVTTPFGDAAPGQLVCKSIKAKSPIDSNTSYVPVEYVLHARQGRNLDTDGAWDSWKFRYKNVGRTGYWDNSGTETAAPFVTSKGLDIPEPVTLKPDGTPYDATIMVDAGDKGLKTPVAAPNVVSSDLYETSGLATFLKLYRHEAVALSGLPIFA